MIRFNNFLVTEQNIILLKITKNVIVINYMRKKYLFFTEVFFLF